MSLRAKIIYISLAFIFFSVTVGCIYYLMGGIVPGINDLKVYELGERTRYVAGLPYEGEPETKEAGMLFLRYRDWIKEDRESATVTQEIMRRGEIDNEKLQFNFLSVINYPTDDDNKVDQFIGVAIRGSSGQLPMGDEEVREVKCDRRYTVFLTMSPFVRPPTAKIERMIKEAASAKGDEIDFFYEIYYPDDSMQIEGFVSDR